MKTRISETSLIAALARPEAFPVPVSEVQLFQTHISAVFVGGDTAYKIKKPVNLGFLDFSTLERRRHFCREEVRINRRLAPEVYQGVVPVAETSAGLQFEAVGPIVEWAVKMTRMPDDLTLKRRLGRGEINATILRSLAERIAEFHRGARQGDEVAQYARFDVVSRNAMENLEVAGRHIGATLSQPVYERLLRKTRQTLEAFKDLIERRATSGVPRDTHGDLRLDHVYWLPDRMPPHNWCILDGIEFDERFRCADPVSDIAFLVMDLAACGQWDLAQSFAFDYFDAARDPKGIQLLPLYASYRAAVRAKVNEILRSESEVAESTRTAAFEKAKAHWLATLVWLEPALTRPQIIMIGGLPGTGKSTLAHVLGKIDGGTVIRSDLVRKELAGSTSSSNSAPFGEGIYSEYWNELTLREMLHRVDEVLWTGGRVIVDATFCRNAHRRQFVDLATRRGVPVKLLICSADPNVAESRLRHRQNDASDADWAIHQTLAKLWEPCSEDVSHIVHAIDANRSIDEIVRFARELTADRVAVASPLRKNAEWQRNQA